LTPNPGIRLEDLWELQCTQVSHFLPCALIFLGLMYTAGFVHSLLNFLQVGTEILDICVFISPWFASNTVIVTYLFAYEVEERTLTGILAAAFVALVPGKIPPPNVFSYPQVMPRDQLLAPSITKASLSSH
jgi:hypothetical protein